MAGSFRVQSSVQARHKGGGVCDKLSTCLPLSYISYAIQKSYYLNKVICLYSYDVQHSNRIVLHNNSYYLDIARRLSEKPLIVYLAGRLK